MYWEPWRMLDAPARRSQPLSRLLRTELRYYYHNYNDHYTTIITTTTTTNYNTTTTNDNDSNNNDNDKYHYCSRGGEAQPDPASKTAAACDCFVVLRSMFLDGSLLSKYVYVFGRISRVVYERRIPLLDVDGYLFWTYTYCT